LNIPNPENYNPKIKTIAVLGSGSWATALVKIFTDSGIHVHWYLRKKDDVDFIKKHLHNKNYLTDVKFNPSDITLSSELSTVIKQNKWIALAIPSVYLEETLEKIKIPLNEKIIISGVKGILPKSNLLIGPYFSTVFGLPQEQFVVISGPSHAEEIALNQLSFLTIGCFERNTTNRLKQMMNAPYLKLKTSNDVMGIEYAATLKNIFALAAGIAKGLGYGDNFQSVLMSNSTNEMKRFLNRINPHKRNINSSVYQGDLLVTAYSRHSRNRCFGEFIGQDFSPKEVAQKMKMVAEGYFASRTIHLLKKEINIKTPIVDAVYDILYNKKSAKVIFEKLIKSLS
jgi:glycerol-3-phosphate dehydrogenase (NAD(P)+)